MVAKGPLEGQGATELTGTSWAGSAKGVMEQLDEDEEVLLAEFCVWFCATKARVGRFFLEAVEGFGGFAKTLRNRNPLKDRPWFLKTLARGFLSQETSESAVIFPFWWPLFRWILKILKRVLIDFCLKVSVALAFLCVDKVH